MVHGDGDGYETEPGCSSVCLLSLSSCGGNSAPPAAGKSAPTAKVDNPKPETDLATVTLSPEAQKHLAIQTMKVTIEPVSLTRTVGGETIVPPGKSVTVTAPDRRNADRRHAPPRSGRSAAGDVIFDLVPLQQSERDVRAEAERALQEAEARLTQTTQRAQRLEQLLKEGSASARSVEEAQADRAVAAAAADAARKRLDSVSRLPVGPRGEMALRAPFDGLITELRAAAGQTVAAGAPVAELAQTSALWIRAPVYVGDLSSLDTSQPALIAALGQETTGPWRQVASRHRAAGRESGGGERRSVFRAHEYRPPSGASASSAAAWRRRAASRCGRASVWRCGCR